MKKLRKKVCYFCGAPATTTEHAPPKMMFRGFPCDKITVPACTAHNNAKDDQAITSAFVIPLLEGTKHSGWKLEPEVDKAIKIAKTSFEPVKRETFAASLVSDPPQPMPKVSYSTANLRLWMKQLTAALMYDGIQEHDSSINWNDAIAWSNNWVDASAPNPSSTDAYIEHLNIANLIKSDFDNRHWRHGWSAYPRPYPEKIYHFYIAIEQDIVFKHVFYSRYTWYVMYSASPNTKTKIQEKVF
jgi:hypothetical protein